MKLQEVNIAFACAHIVLHKFQLLLTQQLNVLHLKFKISIPSLVSLINQGAYYDANDVDERHF